MKLRLETIELQEKRKTEYYKLTPFLLSELSVYISKKYLGFLISIVISVL